jgi:hypothetical protein
MYFTTLELRGGSIESLTTLKPRLTLTRTPLPTGHGDLLPASTPVLRANLLYIF